jgi:hypothetical protein
MNWTVYTAVVAIFTATHFGGGMSTTHTITGRSPEWARPDDSLPYVGAWLVGSFGRASLTIPAAACVGGAIYFVIALVGGP